MSAPTAVLCKNFPKEFETYLNYCRVLTFDAKPDYAYLRRLFRDLGPNNDNKTKSRQ